MLAGKVLVLMIARGPLWRLPWLRPRFGRIPDLRLRGGAGTYGARTLLRHRFPLLRYSSVMAVIAAPIAMQSTYPVGLATLVVLIFLAGLAAAGYFIGRRYLETRPNRRNWR